jgi:hypothetical protein
VGMVWVSRFHNRFSTLLVERVSPGAGAP